MLTHAQCAERLTGVDRRGLPRGLSDPVLFLSAAGPLVLVNPAAETLYAYSSVELSGRPLSMIASTLNGAIIEEMVRASPDAKWQTETVGARKGGERFRAKLNVSPLTDRRTQLTRMRLHSSRPLGAGPPAG